MVNRNVIFEYNEDMSYAGTINMKEIVKLLKSDSASPSYKLSLALADIYTLFSSDTTMDYFLFISNFKITNNNDKPITGSFNFDFERVHKIKLLNESEYTPIKTLPFQVSLHGKETKSFNISEIIPIRKDTNMICRHINPTDPLSRICFNYTDKQYNNIRKQIISTPNVYRIETEHHNNSLSELVELILLNLKKGYQNMIVGAGFKNITGDKSEYTYFPCFSTFSNTQILVQNSDTNLIYVYHLIYQGGRNVAINIYRHSVDNFINAYSDEINSKKYTIDKQENDSLQNKITSINLHDLLKHNVSISVTKHDNYSNTYDVNLWVSQLSH